MHGDAFSVVEYLSKSSGGHCGYCKSRSAIQWGMWAHSISVSEYQNLVDRGWRRSGKYMYKPSMSQTCCPLYTIRCDVGNVRISKSQNKVLKKFYNHLEFGGAPRDFSTTAGGSTSSDGQSSNKLGSDAIDGHNKQTEPAPEEPAAEETVDLNMPGTSNEDSSGTFTRPRKAKLIRLQNKYLKLRSRGMDDEEAVRLTYKTKKTISEKKRALSFEDYFPRPEDMSYFIHKFKIELCPVSIIESDHAMFQETHRLYEKYQMAIHDDSPEDCSMRQLKRFLVDSPLFDSCPNQGPPCGFGTFHQQYWLDGSLIAVGVIDILPKCVSSVYFFYDPDLRSLTLGTYGALQEINFTRGLKLVCPTIEFYYLGYYIHNCPKMNYKGRYHPSELLCPETYTWHKLEKCLSMLEKNKYCRFELDPTVVDKNRNVALKEVMILNNNRAMGYLKYKRRNPEADDEEEVTEYATLVGDNVYPSLLLYRN